MLGTTLQGGDCSGVAVTVGMERGGGQMLFGDLAVISYLVTVIDSIVGCCVSDIAQGWWCDIDPPQTCTCWFLISM